MKALKKPTTWYRDSDPRVYERRDGMEEHDGNFKTNAYISIIGYCLDFFV